MDQEPIFQTAMQSATATVKWSGVGSAMWWGIFSFNEWMALFGLVVAIIGSYVNSRVNLQLAPTPATGIFVNPLSPVLSADVGLAAAGLAQLQAQLRQAEINAPAKAVALRGELASRTAKLVDVQTRLAGLDVRAASAGHWVPRATTEQAGRYVKRGEVLGYVVAGASQVVRTAVPQEDMDLIRSSLHGVQVRLALALRAPVNAQLKRQVPGGDFELVSSALGTAGGGDIAVDPAKPGGTHTLKRVFDVEVALDQVSPAAVFGDRAYVRFDLGTAPLGWQWFLRLRQLFLARLNV